jgi:hypothetical protein
MSLDVPLLHHVVEGPAERFLRSRADLRRTGDVVAYPVAASEQYAAVAAE